MLEGFKDCELPGFLASQPQAFSYQLSAELFA